MSLAARQNTPAFGGAFYYPIKTLYQLQPSFHPRSTEPEPTVRADGNGAPSGPNYLLFVDADRLADALWDRSEVG